MTNPLLTLALAAVLAIMPASPAHAAGTCSFWTKTINEKVWGYVAVNGTARLYHNGLFVQAMKTGTYPFRIIGRDKLYNWKCR